MNAQELVNGLEAIIGTKDAEIARLTAELAKAREAGWAIA